MTDDLPTDVRRSLMFSTALSELGLPAGTVLPDRILNEAITHLIGGDPGRQSAFRRTLLSTDVFRVTPKETRGRGTNYYIHQGIPDHLGDALPEDAQPGAWEEGGDP